LKGFVIFQTPDQVAIMIVRGPEVRFLKCRERSRPMTTTGPSPFHLTGYLWKRPGLDIILAEIDSGIVQEGSRRLPGDEGNG